MHEIGIATLVLLTINGIVSYIGLRKDQYLDAYAFSVFGITVQKQFYRLFTGGFLHGSWRYLLFNMVGLFIFGRKLERIIGAPSYLGLYFICLMGGYLFAWQVHRKKSNYTAVGASGAISALVVSCMVIEPDLNFKFFFIPDFSIPGWIFGVLFLIFSMYGITPQRDKTCHEAHLGGAIIGIIVTLLSNPSYLLNNVLTITLLLISVTGFLFLQLQKPTLLKIEKNPYPKTKGLLNIDDQYNNIKLSREHELNQLLDKIHRDGIQKLTKSERERLEHLSK